MNGRVESGTSEENRGQTLVDYVAGIAIFFVTIAFVLGLLPSFIGPFQSDVAGQDSAQAERISEQLVTNLSVEGTPNELNQTQVKEVLSLSQSDITTRYGIRSHKRVNITVSYLNGSGWVTNTTAPPGINLTSDITHHGQQTGTAARIVRLNNESATCRPACRLLVRVW